MMCVRDRACLAHTATTTFKTYLEPANTSAATHCTPTDPLFFVSSHIDRCLVPSHASFSRVISCRLPCNIVQASTRLPCLRSRRGVGGSRQWTWHRNQLGESSPAHAFPPTCSVVAYRYAPAPAGSKHTLRRMDRREFSSVRTRLKERNCSLCSIVVKPC
jgi:hypothetical protein